MVSVPLVVRMVPRNAEVAFRAVRAQECVPELAGLVLPNGDDRELTLHIWMLGTERQQCNKIHQIRQLGDQLLGDNITFQMGQLDVSVDGVSRHTLNTLRATRIPEKRTVVASRDSFGDRVKIAYDSKRLGELLVASLDDQLGELVNESLSLRKGQPVDVFLTAAALGDRSH